MSEEDKKSTKYLLTEIKITVYSYSPDVKQTVCIPIKDPLPGSQVVLQKKLNEAFEKLGLDLVITTNT